MLKHFDEILHWEFLYLQVENVHLVKFLFLRLRVLHYVSQWPYSDSWLDDTVCSLHDMNTNKTVNTNGWKHAFKKSAVTKMKEKELLITKSKKKKPWIKLLWVIILTYRAGQIDFVRVIW